MRRLVRDALVLIIGLCLFVLPATTEVQLVLYDNFSAPFINPQKWHGVESGMGSSPPNTDTVRQIVRGKLRLLLISYGGTASDSGTVGTPLQRLRVNAPTLITTIQANIIINQAVAEGCSGNSTSTKARAGISGVFFNDGSSIGPEDQTGDILAQIRMVRDSFDGDLMETALNRCSDSTCSSNPP